MVEPTSRRGLLSGAGAAVAAAGVAACARQSGKRPKKPRVVASVDVAPLNALLDLENETIAAYQAGIPLLDSHTAALADQFLRQEAYHAGELAGLIVEAKGKPVKGRLDYPLGHPRTAAEVVALLHSLESRQLTAYSAAITRLSAGTLRSAVASIFANDAQHVALLRRCMHQPPAPTAFVTGRE